MSREIRKLFREHKITKCICNFSCGGDSMNDTQFLCETEDGSELPASVTAEVESFFHEEMYNHVEFYVNSDGHYEGESGTVTITPADDDEDGEDFDYVKDSEEEYNESFLDEGVEFPITATQKKFILDNVSNINGGDRDIAVNFKRDFIMSDADEKLLEKLKEKVRDFMEERQPACEYDGELSESGPTYTTNADGEVLKVVGNNLIFNAAYRSTVFKKGGEIINQD